MPFSPRSFICACASCIGHEACESCVPVFGSLEVCWAYALLTLATKYSATAKSNFIIISPFFVCREPVLQEEIFGYRSSGELQQTLPVIEPAYRAESWLAAGPTPRAPCVTRAGRTATREAWLRQRRASRLRAAALVGRAPPRSHARGRCHIAHEPKIRWKARLELIARDGAFRAGITYNHPPNAPRKAEVGAARNSAACPN